MKHLTVGIFGDNELVKKLGKKGTCNDIEIYNHGSSEGIFTYVCVNSEKIQPVLQVINMIDIPVVVVKELNKEIGEAIIAIDAKGFDKGYILTNNPDSIKSFIKGTCLENFQILEDDVNVLRQELIKIEVASKEGDENEEMPKASSALVPVDNAFAVKSIGTVILGLVREGKIKKHDKLMLEPLGKEVLIKGIQSQDRDIEEAGTGMRVGLNLKGAEADDIRRGYIICKSAKKSRDFTVEFEKSKYNKEELKSGIQIFLNVGLQVSVAILQDLEGNQLKLKTEHELAYKEGEKCVIASTKGIPPRIIGKGKIL